MRPFVWSKGGRWYVSLWESPGDMFRYLRTIPALRDSWFPTAAAAGDAVRAWIDAQ